MAVSDEELELLTRQATSEDPGEVDRAHRQLLTRMTEDERLRQLAALTYDRGRVFAGREQKFGTVAVTRSGERVLWPVDSATTDSERAKWALEPLAGLRAKAALAPLATKAGLRRLLRRRRQNIDEATLRVRSEQIATIGAVALEARRRPGIVAAYWPLAGEADPRPLAKLLGESLGVQLALPVVDGDRMAFRAWHDDASLGPAGFGTLGPGEDAAEVSPAIVLTPLLGFDSRGARLGQGKGFYDHKLVELPDALVVGIAFEAQRLPAVPTEVHDRPLDMIVTERAATAFSG